MKRLLSHGLMAISFLCISNTPALSAGKAEAKCGPNSTWKECLMPPQTAMDKCNELHGATIPGAKYYKCVEESVAEIAKDGECRQIYFNLQEDAYRACVKIAPPVFKGPTACEKLKDAKDYGECLKKEMQTIAKNHECSEIDPIKYNDLYLSCGKIKVPYPPRVPTKMDSCKEFDKFSQTPDAKKYESCVKTNLATIAKEENCSAIRESVLPDEAASCLQMEKPLIAKCDYLDNLPDVGATYLSLESIGMLEDDVTKESIDSYKKIGKKVAEITKTACMQGADVMEMTGRGFEFCYSYCALNKGSTEEEEGLEAECEKVCTTNLLRQLDYLTFLKKQESKPTNNDCSEPTKNAIDNLGRAMKRLEKENYSPVNNQKGLQR